MPKETKVSGTFVLRVDAVAGILCALVGRDGGQTKKLDTSPFVSTGDYCT